MAIDTAMKFFRAGRFILGLALVIGCSDMPTKRFDWKSDWAVKDSFSLSVDTEGYNLPTSIAFVPNPGKNPKDPLYFVTELRGRVKVVTNDRSVHVFAQDFFQLTPEKELPALEGAVGMAGICLDSKRGYVFVTFVYQKENGLLYNNILRFTTKPITFDILPSSQLSLADLFSSDQSGVSHQIGNCQVLDDFLYVGVGDANKQFQSQQLNSVLGKILRLTLEGGPAPGNPFFEGSNEKKPENHIYAYGFRNPFGIRSVGQRIFVVENGLRIDRFLEIDKGENYFWNGNDFSIGAKAVSVFYPSIGPVQMEYYPENISLFPSQYRRRFYIAASDSIATGRPMSGVLSVQYDFDKRMMQSVPDYLVRYHGNRLQSVVGVGLGPDGLYFVPLYANEEGMSPILKITYDPVNKHPFIIDHVESPEVLISENACFSCHSFQKGVNQQGPSLHRDTMVKRIMERLESSEYIRNVQQLDKVNEEPYRRYASARRNVLQAKGMNQVRLWIQYHLIEPRFDNPQSQMPNFGLSEAQAKSITDFLILEEDKTFAERLKSFLKRPSRRFTYTDLMFTFTAGILFALFAVYVVKRKRSR